MDPYLKQLMDAVADATPSARQAIMRAHLATFDANGLIKENERHHSLVDGNSKNNKNLK